jgi:hypothetical protein
MVYALFLDDIYIYGMLGPSIVVARQREVKHVSMDKLASAKLRDVCMAIKDGRLQQ